MAKTTVAVGAPIPSALINALNNPTYSSDPQNDGEIPYPSLEGLGVPQAISDAIQSERDRAEQAEQAIASGLASALETQDGLNQGFEQSLQELDEGIQGNQSAIDTLATRTTDLEESIIQVRIPDTGPNALQLYGATEEGSLTDFDITNGALYQVSSKGSTGVLSLFASFILLAESLVSSSRRVEFRLNDQQFGALATMYLSSPIIGQDIRRHIPVLAVVGASGIKNYLLEVNPPTVFGGNAYFVLVDGAFSPITYASLVSAGGLASRFEINFSTPIAHGI